MQTKMHKWANSYAMRLAQLVRRIRKKNRHDEADFGAPRGLVMAGRRLHAALGSLLR